MWNCGILERSHSMPATARLIWKPFLVFTYWRIFFIFFLCHRYSPVIDSGNCWEHKISQPKKKNNQRMRLRLVQFVRFLGFLSVTGEFSGFFWYSSYRWKPGLATPRNNSFLLKSFFVHISRMLMKITFKNWFFFVVARLHIFFLCERTLKIHHVSVQKLSNGVTELRKRHLSSYVIFLRIREAIIIRYKFN